MMFESVSKENVSFSLTYSHIYQLLSSSLTEEISPQDFRIFFDAEVCSVACKNEALACTRANLHTWD